MNSRLAKIYFNGQFRDEKWEKIQVGDIIQIFNDQFVTVDRSLSLLH